MTFDKAIEIVSNIVNEIKEKQYDGIIVKRLEASNTLDEGRTSKQTHIAISGEQMNIFPYLMSDGYFNCDYNEKDEQLKKYFIAQVPMYISKTNICYLTSEQIDEKEYDLNGFKCVYTCVVRSRRKDQSDQVQLSLTSIDDPEFVSFRKLLHTGDYLVILKRKEKLEYECFGLRGKDAEKGEFDLGILNNKFFKLSTNTIVFVGGMDEKEKKSLDIEYLLDIEKNEKFAKEVMRVLIEEVGFTTDMIDKMTDIEWSQKITKRSLPLLLEIPYDSSEEDVKGLIVDSGNKNRFYPDVYEIFGKKYVFINNWYYKGKSGLDNRTPFVEWIKELLLDRGIECKKHTVERKTKAENILLYGVPGSGKSHTIKTKYCANKKFMERVVFHPDYTYSDFVGQILPRVEKDKDGNDKLKYVFTAGPFTKLLKKAVDDPQNYYYLVIEELNRGNAPAIFGEIFQLLDRKDEDEYPKGEVGESEYFISNYDVACYVYGNADEEVRIPSNMYVLATMNTADQNVFTLDTAFQRRWHMKQIENSFDKTSHSKDLIEGTEVSWGAFATVINDTIIDNNADMVSSEDKRLGTFFAKKKELGVSRFPEKVLKYLWDDAFKMDRTAVFSDSCKSLEDVIHKYEIAEHDRLSTVLRAEIYNKMFSKMKEVEVEETE